MTRDSIGCGCHGFEVFDKAVSFPLCLSTLPIVLDGKAITSPVLRPSWRDFIEDSKTSKIVVTGEAIAIATADPQPPCRSYPESGSDECPAFAGLCTSRRFAYRE